MVDDDESESGVMMESEAKILTGTKGQESGDYMRGSKGWQIDKTTVIIVLRPLRKTSWFLKDK